MVKRAFVLFYYFQGNIVFCCELYGGIVSLFCSKKKKIVRFRSIWRFNRCLLLVLQYFDICKFWNTSPRVKKKTNNSWKIHDTSNIVHRYRFNVKLGILSYLRLPIVISHPRRSFSNISTVSTDLRLSYKRKLWLWRKVMGPKNI